MQAKVNVIGMQLRSARKKKKKQILVVILGLSWAVILQILLAIVLG